MPSGSKWKKILKYNTPWYYKIIDFYLRKPIIIDIILSLLFLLLNCFINSVFEGFLIFSKDALSDILNELISTSLSLGGFVLAALAILASIKQTVSDLDESKKPKDGREFFFNGFGYKNVVQIYSLACFTLLLLFIYFSTLRGIHSSINEDILLNAVFFGIAVLSLTFFRCVALLWAIIKI